MADAGAHVEETKDVQPLVRHGPKGAEMGRSEGWPRNSEERRRRETHSKAAKKKTKRFGELDMEVEKLRREKEEAQTSPATSIS